MNTEALQQLKRVVEEAPDHRFDMQLFEQQTHCGTARCAAGWAAVDDWFQANTNINHALPVQNGRIKPQYTPHLFALLGTIFEITTKDAENLFAAESGFIQDDTINKREVLDNIDSLIAGNGTREYDAIQQGRRKDWIYNNSPDDFDDR